MTNPRPIPTNNYVDHFDKNKAHHRAFFQATLDRVAELDPKALQPGGDLRDIWVAAVETKAPSPTPNISTPPVAAQGAPAAPVTWETMVQMASAAGARYPELVAAQGALESAWYKTPSGKNNFFGLKGAGTKKTTREFINGKWITIADNFIDFPSPQASVNYLVERWYKDFRNHKGVDNATNREAAAKMLVSEGYATDPEYAQKLIRIMNEKAPAKSAPPAIQLQQGGPRLIVIPGADGPKKSPYDFNFKTRDSHIIVNDINQTARAFSHDGRVLWEVKALARGQGSDTEYRHRNTDTPPGLYKIGEIYRDYERAGANPAFDQTLRSYGWYTFDMIELENQEAKYGRAGICLHGGGSACGWPGAWAPKQQLFPTHGCVRMHNIDLRDKVLPLTKSGTVFISVFQEKLK
jgi:lipoprotein-anchoring transpeptidase ErfK/SrfK